MQSLRQVKPHKMSTNTKPTPVRTYLMTGRIELHRKRVAKFSCCERWKAVSAVIKRRLSRYAINLLHEILLTEIGSIHGIALRPNSRCTRSQICRAFESPLTYFNKLLGGEFFFQAEYLRAAGAHAGHEVANNTADKYIGRGLRSYFHRPEGFIFHLLQLFEQA